MNPPKNFKEKLDSMGRVQNLGRTYPLSVTIVDNNQSHVWLYNKSKNALCVRIYWDRMEWSLGIAEDGDGPNFHTELPNIPLWKSEVSSPMAFIGLLEYIIETHGYYFIK